MITWQKVSQSGERNNNKCIIGCKIIYFLFYSVHYLFSVSLWWRANTRNVRLYYPYWQYTDLFIFRFVSLLCAYSTHYAAHYVLFNNLAIFPCREWEGGPMRGFLSCQRSLCIYRPWQLACYWILIVFILSVWWWPIEIKLVKLLQFPNRLVLSCVNWYLEFSWWYRSSEYVLFCII